MVKDLPAVQKTQASFLGQEDPLERDRLPTPVFLGFPCGSAGKESTYNVGDLGSIPGLGRSPGEGTGYSLQYSDLENSKDCLVHGVMDMTKKLNSYRKVNLESSSEEKKIWFYFIFVSI